MVIPQLDMAFKCSDNTVLLFDGQWLMHGVTDIVKDANGYRYSIVFYNMKGMSKCLSPEEELEHYQRFLDRKNIQYGEKVY
ncbi:hypothetical protein D3C73_1563920 [compost metagenome]